MNYVRLVGVLNSDVVSYCKDVFMRLRSRSTREAYSEAERIERESSGLPLHNWAWVLPGLSRLYARAVSDSLNLEESARLDAEQAVRDNASRVLLNYDYDSPLLRLVDSVRDERFSGRAAKLRRKESVEDYEAAQETAADYTIIGDEYRPDSLTELVGESVLDAVNELANVLDIDAGGVDVALSVNERVVSAGNLDIAASAEVQPSESGALEFVVPGERVEGEFFSEVDDVTEEMHVECACADAYVPGNFMHRLGERIAPYAKKSRTHTRRALSGISGAVAALSLAGLFFYFATSYNKLPSDINLVNNKAVVENAKPSKEKNNFDGKYSLAFGGILGEEGCSYYTPSLERIVSGSKAGVMQVKNVDRQTYEIIQKAKPVVKAEGKRDRVKPAAGKKTETKAKKIASSKKQKGRMDFSAVRSKIQHNVVKGESLWRIVKEYGARDIAAAVNDVVGYNASKYPYLKEDNIMVDKSGRTVRGQDGIMGDVIRVKDTYDMAPVVAGLKPFEDIAKLAKMQKNAFDEADKSLREMNKYFGDMHKPDSKARDETSNAKILEHISKGLI